MSIKLTKISNNDRLSKIIRLIVILFLSGNIITFIGFSKGEDIASTLSRPSGVDVWVTSHGMV